MYKCRHFAIHELVPPIVYQARGEKAWELLDERLLITIDNLRDMFGKMTINNYYWGGDRKWSGLRTHDSPYGSEYSQHRFGRAVDIIFGEADVDRVRQFILNSPSIFPFINSVELETSWLHIDVRNCDRIKTYKPS